MAFGDGYGFRTKDNRWALCERPVAFAGVCCAWKYWRRRYQADGSSGIFAGTGWNLECFLSGNFIGGSVCSDLSVYKKSGPWQCDCTGSVFMYGHRNCDFIDFLSKSEFL